MLMRQTEGKGLSRQLKQRLEQVVDRVGWIASLALKSRGLTRVHYMRLVDLLDDVI